jgi:hypothetical protein
VPFHSFDQVFIITMLSKYDVNETSIWLEHLTPKRKNSWLKKPHMLASSIFMRPSSASKSATGHLQKIPLYMAFPMI